MRIESYGPAATDISKQLNSTNAVQTGKVQPGTHNSTAVDKTTLSASTAASENKPAPPSPAPATEDKTTLSSTPAAAQSLTQTALQAAASRASKVEDLKQAVNSAQYKLDAAKIAEALSNGGF